MRPGVILRNAGALVAAQVLTKALNLAVSIALVRWLGAHELGRYAYVLAFAFPFGAAADFGLATLAIREVSREPAREAAVLATLQRLAAALSAGAAGAMLTLAAVLGHDRELLTAIALAAVCSLLSALNTPALVQLTVRERMHWLSAQRVAGSVLGSLLVVGVLLAGGRLVGLMLASAATSVFTLLLARRLAGPRRGDTPATRGMSGSMLRQAVPFGLLMTGFALYYRIDMVMLEWLAGSREVGLYAASYRFLDAVIVLAASLGGPLFPRLSSLAATRPAEARGLLEDAWRPLLALGLPLSIGTSMVAGDLTALLFGLEFAESAGLLRVLIWGTLPLLWVNVANHALIAVDRVWPLVAVYAGSAALTVLANVALIPRFGAMGASLATLACEWLNLALVVRLLGAAFGPSFSPGGVWRYVVAGAGMAAAMWLAHGYGLAVEASVGALVYGGALLALGYMRSADHLAVKRLLAQ